jgi:hypothetical protein
LLSVLISRILYPMEATSEHFVSVETNYFARKVASVLI